MKTLASTGRGPDGKKLKSERPATPVSKPTAKQAAKKIAKKSAKKSAKTPVRKPAAGAAKRTPKSVRR